MDLGRNSIGAIFRNPDGGPMSKEEVSELTGLDVSRRGLAELPSQQLSCCCRKLKRLDLSYNQLVAFPLQHPIDSLIELNLRCQSVPSGSCSVNKWPALQHLPENVAQFFRNLAHLNLSQNALRSLPDSLGQLAFLRTLDVSSNVITVFPDCVCSLRSLTHLSLSGNSIGQIPHGIGNLKQLSDLRLAGNDLHQLPDELSLLDKLHTLSLQRNRITHLPQNFHKLQALIHTFEGSPMDDRGEEAPGLSLRGNPLEYPPVDICQLGVSKMMDYMKNNPHDGVCNIINIRDRGLEQFPRIASDESATVLDATNNSLQCLPLKLHELLPNLSLLLMSGNAIENFPPGLWNLKKLEVLSLQMQHLVNGYRCFSVLPHSLMMMQNLQELYLAKNAITTIPSEIRHMRQLKNLDLQDNQIEALPGEICQLTNLQCLLLRRNNISALPDNIGCLLQLQVLQLSKNRLSTLPDSVCHLTKLSLLTLRDNQLVCLPRDLDRLTALSGTEPFEYITVHTTFKERALKLKGNALMFPPQDECWDVTNVFSYLVHMRGMPDLRDDVIRKAKAMVPVTQVSTGKPPRNGFQLLTETFRWDLAGRLGNTEFFQLGNGLGVAWVTMEQIRTDYQVQGLKCQIFFMLRMWVNRQGGFTMEHVLVQQLKQQLSRLGRMDLVEELFPP